MGKDFKRAFLEQFEVIQCWNTNGFWPELEPNLSKTEVVMVGSDYCYNFFVTNGLYGLLESEWGKMVPELLLGCVFLRCHESSLFLNSILQQIFPKDYPRDDDQRKARVDPKLDWLHDLSDSLDTLLIQERMKDKLCSYFEYVSKKRGILPKEVVYEVTTESDPSWQDIWENDI